MDSAGALCLSAGMIGDRRFAHVVTAAVVLATVLILLLMGRAPWCPCGHVDLWGTVGSEEANMQLLDWYTPSHVLHGILLYAALWLTARKIGVGWRLTIATVVECAWEVLENTDAMIRRYRDATVSVDYIGDSVLNSTSDIVAMLLGFGLARFVPVRVSVAAVIGFEVLTAFTIRDGLTLNVLMVVWPVESIRDWQMGG